MGINNLFLFTFLTVFVEKRGLCRWRMKNVACFGSILLRKHKHNLLICDELGIGGSDDEL